MSWLTAWTYNTWLLALDAAPWLLLGLIAAGLIHAFVPTARLSRWLGGGGVGPVVKAALIGAPLPLCSCGVIPAAVALRRRGASPGATVSFLVATPETGVDSVAISYALLGPFMMVVRPVAAVLSAVLAGFTAQFVPVREAQSLPIASSGSGCCGDASGCCDGAAAEAQDADDPPPGPLARLGGALRYAASDLLDDLSLWLLVGLALAGAAATFLTPEVMQAWGSGLPTMLLMLVVGVPMYICATASTPLAAALLLAGLSPGTVLVFLLAGPATNLATLGILRKEMGTAMMAGYLAAISVSAVGLGLLTDVLAGAWGINVPAQIGEAGEVVPGWLALACLAVLVVLGLRPLRRRLIGR